MYRQGTPEDQAIVDQFASILLEKMKEMTATQRAMLLRQLEDNYCHECGEIAGKGKHCFNCAPM